MGARLYGLHALLSCVVLASACGDDATATDAGMDASADAAVDTAPVDAAPDGTAPDAGDAFVPPSRVAEEPLVQWVDPAIGSGGLGFGVGSASVAPQRPFGMIRPGPDTGYEDTNGPNFYHCSGYHDDDPYVWGFSQMRMHGTGIVDYGHIALMPLDGFTMEQTDQTGYRAPLDKDSEEVEVGYYAVEVLDDGRPDARIRAEITAGERVGRHRYSFAEGADPVVLIDAGHTLVTEELVDAQITLDPERNELSGFSHIRGGYSGRFGGVRVYFVVRFDQTPTEYGTFTDGVIDNELERDGDAGAWFRFDASQVEAAVGVSFVDVAHARLNLEAESGTFDELRSGTVAAWETLLSRVTIEGRSEDDFTRFYTALYQSLLMPTLASDADGAYRGVDDEVHVADFRYSTDFSLWDTFRTQIPLLGLLYPELLQDQMRSLMQMSEDGGFMPRWPLGHGYTGGMVGESAGIAFEDARVRGIELDYERAYALLRPTAFGPGDERFRGRRDIEGYLSRGYVASDAASWSVSATLEFAYADWAIGRLAEAAGETEDAEALFARGNNWQNTWDEERGYFVGRTIAGDFDPDFEDDRWQGYYAEGNARQYLWYVPHDLDGLADQLGGRATLLERLGSFFELSTFTTDVIAPSPYYWQGNEPDIHAPWIFSWFGEVEQSAEWTRWVARTYFGMGPRGLPGNDDSGTMSAWYVFASLGFYPIAGTDTYLYSAPLLTGATLTLPDGDFVIRAEGAHDGATFADATLNGAEPAVPGRFTQADLAGGAELVVEME